MARIRLDGIWYEWHEPTISEARLKQRAGLRAERGITVTSANMGKWETLPDVGEISIEPNAVVQATSFPKGIRYGTDVNSLSQQRLRDLKEREKFILAQVFQISERYYFRNKNSLMLSESCDFLVIRDFPLPPYGDWLSRNASFCVYFPKSYPRQPPLGFFVDAALQHKGSGENHLFKESGIYREPDAFFQKHALGKKGYGFYCWHVEENWQADSTNPLKPDNLDTFLKIAYNAFDSKGPNGRRTVKRIW